jgi:hypothetical protein
MISLTAEAGQVLEAGISEEELRADVSYRFAEQETGEVALTKGLARDGDVEVDYQGETVLRVPESIADRLGDVTLDAVPAGDGSHELVLRSAD